MMLRPHHRVWLAAHPHRTAAWLRERIADGFDVHHIDGDDANDHSSNLILLETTDHTLTIHKLPCSRLDAVKAMQERVARLDAAFAAAGMERGAYVSKTIKGKVYWYFQDAKTRKQHYIGPDFSYLRNVVIAGYNEAKREIIANVV